MRIPPVIDQIRQKRIPDDEIRAYYAVSSSGLEAFRDLAALFSKHEQALALELVRLPLEHPFWAAAPQSQNFQDAVLAFLDYRLRENPMDIPALWTRIGLGVMRSMSPDLMGPYWRPLLAENPRNIRWTVEAALWIWTEYGKDTTDGLREVLAVLHESADRDRSELRSDPDTRMAVTAGIALEVANGLRLPELWERHAVSFG